MRIVNRYEVAPRPGGGSLLRHAFEVSGPIGGVARVLGLGRLYTRLLRLEIDDVARLAERGLRA
jgi:hypothetical protein